MFPTLWNNLKPLAPEVFFGGAEVPEYNTLNVTDQAEIAGLATAIRANAPGSNWCGYVDGDGVHYHVAEEGDLHVDGSRDFVFLAPMTGEAPEIPSPLGILNFLQDPTSRALFVFRKTALFIRKTPATWDFCARLDRVWHGDRMGERLGELLPTGRHVTHALSSLMKIYEEENGLQPTEMWEFWRTFWPLLLEDRLHLHVQILGEEGG